jgi:hypothetical protein
VSNLVESAIRQAYRPGSRVVARTRAGGLTVSDRRTGAQPADRVVGVAIAGTLASAMGGELLVESDRYLGTTFTLRLPPAAG